MNEWQPGFPVPGKSFWLKNSISLKLMGLRDRYAFVQLSEDKSRIIVAGDMCGRVEVPLDAITDMRVGGRGGVKKFYHCVIRREGGWPVALCGTSPWSDYKEFVLRLAGEMERRGRFDRVRRGLPLWHALFLLLICQAALPFLIFNAYMWVTYGERMEIEHFAILIGTSAFWLGLYGVALWIWATRYWPRRARSPEDLRPVLPIDAEKLRWWQR